MNISSYSQDRFARRRTRSAWMAGLALAALASAGFAAAAPPSADRDRDGVPDRLDLCRATPPGATLIGKGCSALDIALAPEILIDPVRSKLAEQAAALESDSAYAEAGRVLREGSLGLAEAGEVMRKGDVCRAADLFASVVNDLKGGETNLESAIHSQAPRLLGARDVRTGLPEGALSVAFLRVHQSLTQQAVDDADAVSGFARAACAEVVGAGRLRGQVTEVDDASRTFRMKGDRRIGIAAVALPPGLMPGRTIDGRGLRFADGTALLTSLRADLPAAGPAPKTTPCLSAYVAPFQQFPPFKEYPSEPYRLRERGGYAQGMYGILALEATQRLAAEAPNPPCSPGGFLNTHFYSMKIDVTQGANTWTIANALKDADTPVALPASLVIGQIATVTATIFQTNCTFTCGAPQVQSTEAFALVVRPFGSYASVGYDKTVFDAAENGTVVHFTSLTLTNVPDPNPIFGSTGHNFNTSYGPFSPPTPVLIDDVFLVYPADNLYDDFETPETNLGTHGVDHPAGLIWPALSGTNSNGKAFEYSVTLPHITRDLVADCAGTLDTLYLLPYSGGYPVWQILKGNFDDPTVGYSGTHKFALAFSGPTGGDVYAARGGRVVAIDESHAVTDSIDPSSTGNFLSIRHDDGTFGFYFHLAQNGVLLNVGDIVGRHYHIAQAGGGKLVFEVGSQPTPSASGFQTVKALYESFLAVPGPGIGTWIPGNLVDCQVPRVGDKLISTQ